jgi:hypothetical protein
MPPNLENLKITARELERLTGWDVGPIFLGGVLEAKHQAQEYAQILNQALEIGMTVHQEVQKLSQ